MSPDDFYPVQENGLLGWSSRDGKNTSSAAERAKAINTDLLDPRSDRQKCKIVFAAINAAWRAICHSLFGIISWRGLVFSKMMINYCALICNSAQHLVLKQKDAHTFCPFSNLHFDLVGFQTQKLPLGTRGRMESVPFSSGYVKLPWQKKLR